MRDSILYVFGGQLPPSISTSQTLPLFASLNLTAEFTDSTSQAAWVTLPSSKAIPVLNPQCVLTDTHLLVVGGEPLSPSIANPFSTGAPMTYCGLQAYSFADNAWQSLIPETGVDQMTAVSLNRTGHTASWIRDVGNGSPGLFVMGGIHFNATLPANDAFMLNPFIIPAEGGQAIIGVSSVPNNLPPPTVNSGSATVNGGTSVLFFGGKVTQTQEEPTSIWEYTPSSQLWKSLPVSLPQGMPNVLTGWVDSQQQNLITIDVSTVNTAEEVCVVSLANAGLRRRQSPPASSPAKMDGYSVAFDPIRNLAIVSGGDGTNPNNLNVFNMTDKSWSVLNLQKPLQPTSFSTISATPTTFATRTSSATSSLSSSSGTITPTDPSIITPNDSTGFNKANLLAPIILGSILGLLGILGLLLLLISYRRRQSRKNKADHSHASVSPAGLWLKYGNRKPEDPVSAGLGGEIFLRNLEEKHGLKRNQSELGRTGWSKYFSASWYHSNQPQRTSGSTTNTARALVSETNGQNAYGGGWDAESHYSKASSFVSIRSERSDHSKRESFGRWSGLRWSYQKKARASNASSGVLGNTLGAGGVHRV